MTNEEHYEELITTLGEDTDDPFFAEMAGSRLNIPMGNALKDKYPFDFTPSPDSIPFLEYVVKQFPFDDAEVLFYNIQYYVLTTKRDTLEKIKNNKNMSLPMQLKKEREVNDYYSTVESLLYKIKGMLKEKYFRECKKQHPDISDSKLRKYIKHYKKLKELARKHSTKYFQTELENALNDGFSVNFIPNAGLDTESILHSAVRELNDWSRKENYFKKTTYKINLLLDNGAEVNYDIFRVVCLGRGDLSVFERCLAKFPDVNQKQDDKTVLDEICYSYWGRGIPFDNPQVDEEFRTKIKLLLDAGAEPKDLERDKKYLETRTSRQLESYEILIKLIRTYQEQMYQQNHDSCSYDYEL